MEKDEWIKARAYSLWENDGYQHGRDAEHWQQAQADWNEMQQQSQTGSRARAPTDSEKTESLARVGKPGKRSGTSGKEAR